MDDTIISFMYDLKPGFDIITRNIRFWFDSTIETELENS